MREKNIWERIRNSSNCRVLILNLILTLCLNLLLEFTERRSVGEVITFVQERTFVFLYNGFIIFLCFSIVFLVRKRIFAYVFISGCWVLVAIANGVVLSDRKTPFTAVDLTLVKSVLPILGSYLEVWQILGIVILLVVGIGGLVCLYLYSPEDKRSRHLVTEILCTAVTVVCFCAVTYVGVGKGMLIKKFDNLIAGYKDYGVAYGFCVTAIDTGIDRPINYSRESVNRIKKKVKKAEKKQKETKKAGVVRQPNIIFIQLESFFDATTVKNLNISEDPIPTFRKLMKEYSSGYYKVPSVGAGTANTEFESITGMSMHYFGPGEYPYKSILRETTCESAPYVLKKLGYTTHAVHNNEANFYGRRSIFPNLGFDTFTSEEYMARENEKNPNGWVKDEVLTDEILKCLDSTEGPDYVYTISVQGHGAYPDEQILEDPEITVSGAPTEEENNKWEYYVNEIHEMDNFVKELTDKLADYPEDVVLVMYGDHLPTMGLTVEDLKNKYLFQTEYVMWDNFGLKKKNENLAAYQMAAEVMDRVGIHEGTVFRYHQARRNTRNYQVDLETLQYDLLYGKRYSYGESGDSPYLRTRMRMGIYDVTLDSIQCISEADHTYYIKGTEFTPSSEIKLNGEWYDTVYINPTTLMITGTELNDFDRLAVIQRSNSSTRKPLSKSYDRSCYALYSNNKWKLTESAGTNEN